MAMYQAKTEMGGVSGWKKQHPKNLCDAKDVTPRKSPGWSVLVQVVEKRKQKESRSCPGLMYKNYILTDMQGMRIPAVTFGSNVAAVDRLLFPYKRYFISNAGVRDAKDGFRLADYPYNWVLTYRTPIRLLEESVPHPLPCPFHFTDFSAMHTFADRDDAIEFKALVVHARTISGSGESAVRDYVVINQEKRPMIMRLWSDWLDNADVQASEKLPEPTLIVGLNMKVTTHNGVSLTTKTNGYIMVEPPLAGNAELMNWYRENSEEIANLLAQKAYRNTDYLIPPPTDAVVVPIATVISSIENIKTAWVRATIHLIPGQENLWTTVCGKCRRGVDGPVGWNTFCSSCSEDIEVEPRSRFNVYLYDGITTLEAILYSPDTERPVPYTSHQIFEAQEKGVPLNNEIEAELSKKKVYCYLKYFESDFGGRLVKKFPILKVYPVEENTVEEAAVHGDVGGTSDPVQEINKDTPASAKEKQLFSPTAGEILDDIEKDLPDGGAPDAQASVVKRALTFGPDLSDPSPPVLSAEADLTDVPARAPVALTQSPAKKVKGREKEKQN